MVNSPVRDEVYASEATVEIILEADFETLPEERRQATGEAVRRAARKDR